MTRKKEEQDLYKVLGLDRDATQADVKRAYYKLALKLHPDKNPNDKEANAAFQSLQRIYAVLGDSERRKIYDETGSIDDSEEFGGEKFANLYQYYRTIFKQVTEEDITKFEEQYRGSPEEERDLLDLYRKHNGRMGIVFEWLMCSRADQDSHRFLDILQANIEKGDAKSYTAYEKWRDIVRSKPRPSALNPKKGRKLKGQAKATASRDHSGLIAQIRGQREERMNNTIAALEAKYSKSSNRNKRQGHKGEDISDTEFQAIQASLEKRRKQQA